MIKALCMGAHAVLIGRAYAYGLMAEGREGVAKAIGILKADLERTMILLGVASLAELDDSFVDVPDAAPGSEKVDAPGVAGPYSSLDPWAPPKQPVDWSGTDRAPD